MADPVADNADFAVDELKRKARRRLVGAIVIALAAATILPLVLEKEQKPLGDDVSVQIPAVDNGKFVSRLKDDKSKDAPAGGKADGGAAKAPDSVASTSAPAPAASTASSGIAAPVAVPVPTAADGGSRPVPDAKVAAAEATNKGSDAKAETKATAKAASKADGKATPGTDVASKARDVKPEPKAAPATAATPSAPPPNPSPPAEVAMAAPAPATASEAPVMPPPPTTPPAAETPKAEGYVVQLGAFTDNYGANALANRLKKAGYPAFTEPVETKRGTLWRVRVGGYPTRPAAVEARNRLKADGHDGVVTAAK